MAGCLGFIFILLGIVFLFNFPIATIGIAILLWGLYELSENKKLKAKSKVPAVIMIIGLLIAVTGCTTSGTTKEQSTKSTVEETDKEELDEEKEKGNEAAKAEEERKQKEAEEKAVAEDKAKEEAEAKEKAEREVWSSCYSNKSR